MTDRIHVEGDVPPQVLPVQRMQFQVADFLFRLIELLPARSRSKPEAWQVQTPCMTELSRSSAAWPFKLVFHRPTLYLAGSLNRFPA